MDIMDETKKNSVLVVDDENKNLMSLSHILSQDYNVYAAKGGQEAIDSADQYLPDLILLDTAMPDMDGYAVFASLKNSEKTQAIPIIFVAEVNDIDAAEKGLALGGADYITKPFSPAVVKLRVQNQIKIVDQMRLIIEKENAEKSNRAKSEFLSRMNHEMRSPMNAIKGMTSLAKSTLEAEKRDAMLDKINTASSNLLKLIDDVLDMSDLEDNKLRLFESEFSFSVMIRDILNKADPDIKAKQQTLTTDIDTAIPETLYGDERRLSQVILTLLGNANTYTPEHGQIQITAFVSYVEDESLTMQIEVLDNGVGMTVEQCENLFVPFTQTEEGIDRKFIGGGLGLVITKHIIELMGGEIRVESKPDKGSKFVFTFKSVIRALETRNESPISLEGKNVLLVEDIEINREIVIAMFENTGLKIDCAENGRVAVEMFEAAPDKYDLILMDINMPEMDGLEATVRIRSLAAPEGANIPIIAMTANVLMSEVNTYLDAGMTDHIGKPVNYDKLLSKFYRYMSDEAAAYII